MKQIVKLKNAGQKAGTALVATALAISCTAPAPSIAFAAQPVSQGAAVVAQSLPSISTAAVSHPMVWAGDTSVSFTLENEGTPITDGYTVTYFNSNEAGEILGAVSGPFEAGGFYLATITADETTCTGTQNVAFTASGAIDLTDNWNFQVRQDYAYTGNPLVLEMSYTDENGYQYAVDPDNVVIVYYDANGTALGEAPSECGDYGFSIIGDGVHFTGSLGSPEMPQSAFVYEPVDFDDCTVGEIADIAYTGSAVYPEMHVFYPDGYANSGKEVDSRLYDVKFYDGEGNYLGDWEYPSEIGSYTAVIEGSDSYGCTGSCEGSLRITDDKEMLPVYMVDSDGTLVYSVSFEETGANPPIAYRIGSYDADGITFTELGAEYYTVDIVNNDGDVVSDYSEVGLYRVRATGKNGYLGTTYGYFEVTEKAVAPEPDAPAPGPATPSKPVTVAHKNMHRLYNPNSGEHFYTASEAERDNLIRVGWSYEGVGWKAPTSGSDVYRLYNPNAGDHHYTTSASERDYLVKVGWRYEGVGWKSGGSAPLYRQYNPNAVSGTHNYTISKAENDFLIRVGWHGEGVGWYGIG